MRGLLAPLSRKNGWQISEYIGEDTPWGQQHLLDRAVWDAEVLRDFTRRYVIAGLEDGGLGAGPSGSGVLVVDETGFAKRGSASAGVARQYSGALGGVFPCQVGVMAAWATGIGQALIDRELYLPREWTEDRERCRRARVPDRVGFAVKPRLAEQMIDRAVPDLPQGQVWVAADEVYGRDGAFRRHLEDHDLRYVVTVQANQSVLPRPGWRHIARLVERCAAEDEWDELPAGPSQLDSRTWQWWVRRIPAPDAAVGSGRARWLLARRRPETPDERDYYLGWGPEDTSVEDLVLVPGARWRVEEAIKLAKSAAGMADSRYVTSTAGIGTSPCPSWPRRSWPSRPPPNAAASSPVHPTQGARSDPTLLGGLAPITLTAFEIARLLVLMDRQPTREGRIRHGLHWSRWRRLHQAIARACHRRRRHDSARPPPTSEPRTTASTPIYD
ncbi:IS701 family transposase [Streptomyces sp. NPDC005799]|uniref:IS701 family transposase n=1 Tax=Streptomyces sp. NPDC005799 TaxID=3154678 RepID=UPI0033CDE17E